MAASCARQHARGTSADNDVAWNRIHAVARKRTCRRTSAIFSRDQLSEGRSSTQMETLPHPPKHGVCHPVSPYFLARNTLDAGPRVGGTRKCLRIRFLRSRTDRRRGLLDDDATLEDRIVLVRVVVKSTRSFDVHRARRTPLSRIQEADVVDRRTVVVNLNGVGTHGVRTRVVIEERHVTAGGNSHFRW